MQLTLQQHNTKLMLVFKFGGASVKDADGLVNLANVVKRYEGKQLLIVVSAMGKTTNALEKLTKAYVDGDDKLYDIFDEIKKYHEDIMNAARPQNFIQFHG